MKQYIYPLLLWFFLAGTARSQDYLVDADGGYDYTTISDCAADAQAGERCIVRSGSYGGFTPPRNGSEDNFIVFMEAEGHSATITSGITLDNREYLHFDGFTMDGTFRNSANARANHIKITNMDFINNGASMDISLHASHVLVSDVTFVNKGDDCIRLWGEYWVIRNATLMHEVAMPDKHFDFLQTWESDGYSTAYVLVENLTMIDVSGGHTHFLLFNDTDNGNPRDVTKIIVRYNKVHDIGSQAVYLNDDPQEEAPTYDNVCYNNTFSKMNHGSQENWQNYANPYNASINSTGVNNIFHDALSDGDGGTRGFLWDTGGAQSYNLYYDPDDILSFQGLALDEVGAVKNEDPLIGDMDNNDFSLDPDSPAIDKGGPLTFVASGDAGSGSSLVVEKAEFFQDGWGIDGVDADWIAVGATDNTARISSINYETNTITLATPITRSMQDPVYLFRDSDGTRVLYGSAPDIGAFEYGGDDTMPPAAPAGLTAQ